MRYAPTTTSLTRKIEANRADAVSKVDHDQRALLPDGPGTTSHHFFIAEVAGNRVGTLWLMEQKRRGDTSVVWVMNVETEPQARRRGYGRAIMLLAEEVAKNLGYRRIALHVFTTNEAAIALYASLGYRVAEFDSTGQLMSKDVAEAAE